MHVVNALACMLDKTCLTTDLCSDFIVRETRGREDGQFLTTGN